MSSDSDDDQVGKTWISVRSLKQAADIKTVYRAHLEDDRSPSPHSSLNSSVTAESAPNTVINVSPSFSNLHESYMNMRDEGTEGRRWVAHSRDSSASTNRMVTRRAHDEVLELQQDLLQSRREVEYLRSELAKRDQQHALQLQMIQAHHERKMHRSRCDLEELMRQQPKKQMELTMNSLKAEHANELRCVCDKYEEEIDQMRMEHELELQGKEEEFAKLIDDLKAKLKETQRQAEDREKELARKHKAGMEKMERRHRTEIAQLTRRPSVKSPELNRFRRIPKLEIQTDFSSSEDHDSGLESELSALRRKVEDQEMIIKSQECALEELKSHLCAAFRKKSPEPKSIHVSRIGLLDISDELGNSQGLESELKQIISQIDVHLDEEHLNTTQSFSDTLKNLRGKIEAMSGTGPLQV